jgi:hypothetical protein
MFQFFFGEKHLWLGPDGVVYIPTGLLFEFVGREI